MNIELYNHGELLEYLYQWDRDIELTIKNNSGCEISEVHFSNLLSNQALVLEPYDKGTKVKVPNILLTKIHAITIHFCAFAEDGGFKTFFEYIVPIRPRQKPEEYVYTETEVLSYKNLEKRVSDIENRDYTPIKGIDYFTEAEIEEMIGKTSAELKKDTEPPEYYSEYLSAKTEEIKALMDEAGSEGIAFIMFSDSHFELSGEGMNGGNSGKLAHKLSEECGIPNIFFLGDANSNSPQETSELCIESLEAFNSSVKPLNGRLSQILGNHDGAYGLPVDEVTYPFNLPRGAVFNRALRKNGLGTWKCFGSDGSYFYMDDRLSKTRFIMLNTSDIPYTAEENGTMAEEGNTMKGFSVRQAQADWLIESLKVEKGWRVCVFSHIPLHDSLAPCADYIRNILKAYKNKTSYSATYSGQYSGEAVASYTNLADISSSDWLTDQRLNSSGIGSAVTGVVATNYIEVTKGDIVRVQGMELTDYNSAVYDSEKAVLGSQKLADYASTSFLSDITATAEGGQCTIDSTGIKYIRFSGVPTASANEIIITVNEEIAEAASEAWDSLKLNADFSEDEGEFVCLFCGHAHNDYHYSADSFGIDMLSIACDGRVSNCDYMTDETYSNRDLGTVYEQVLDTVIINKALKTVKTVRIGAGENREISFG